ncbi:MAG: UDP-N-acetylmuramate dehydrogenase [Bacilli bacterium]|nr:UDP-N-acetylmuramate dehydrogenase [Bacilli bacterium]
MNDVIKEIKKLDIKVEENVSLAKLTTYKVGGKARLIAYPDSTKELLSLLKILKKNNIKHKVLGNGSNLLFSSKLYDGCLISLKKFDKCKFLSNNRIRVGAGFSLTRLSMLAAKHSLTGLEFASGIPATVGGAVYMNAGAYKSDMGYVVSEVKVLTGEEEVITLVNRELNFHYRSSFLQKHKDYIVLEVLFKLAKGKKEAILEVIDNRRERRIESQPLNYPSCGSVFRNPEGDFAGRLIEEAGLKGYSIGGAKVSEKHANFIINYNNATSEDIHDLILYVHDQVKEKYGVDLRIEQEFVNWE